MLSGSCRCRLWSAELVCGIALVVGPGAGGGLFRQMLASLAPRGESEGTHCEDGLLAGVHRLRIVDRDRAVQPWVSPDGRWVLCYNGEIFNFRQLRAELTRRGRRMRSESDTEVALEAFLHWGDDAVTRMRGEFAFAIADRATGATYLARDPLGVKPLYWSSAAGRLYVASEIKALVPVGAPVSEVPPGHHGWAASPAQPPDLSPYIDLLSLGDDCSLIEDPDEAAKLVRLLLEDSIRVRVDTDLTVGVVLSGGLDSSLILAHVLQMHPDCVALTVGAPDSLDVVYAARLARELGVPHEVVEVRPNDIRLSDVEEAVRMSELTEYGDIINAVVSVPLFARMRRLGVKVVLTGDGADELFGGYGMYQHIPAEASRRLFLHKIANLYRTELQRVDRVSMGQGVEARVPFLDLPLVDLAMRLPTALKVRDGQEKWILRHAFADLLPAYVLARPKDPMSHSSGLHERARLYRPLFGRLHRTFGYDALGAVRRDFSALLAQCGYNLDQALADSESRRDYTALEHAVDLAGALRWNAAAALRELV
jgi:asparagine synthase (glutamine-hydrolysing)